MFYIIGILVINNLDIFIRHLLFTDAELSAVEEEEMVEDTIGQDISSNTVYQQLEGMFYLVQS